MTTKEEFVADIAELLGVEAPPMSTGSTEPKEIFQLINRELGLGLPTHLGKPDSLRASSRAPAWSGSPTSSCPARR